MAKNSTILLNSCETDLKELKKDVEAGLYLENTGGYLKEVDRITKKMADAREEVLFERERELAGVDERMVEEAENELTDMFGEGGKEEVKEYYQAEERLVEEAGKMLSEKIGKPKTF